VRSVSATTQRKKGHTAAQGPEGWGGDLKRGRDCEGGEHEAGAHRQHCAHREMTGQVAVDVLNGREQRLGKGKARHSSRRIWSIQHINANLTHPSPHYVIIR